MSKLTKKIKEKLPVSDKNEHKTEKEKLEERREEILAQGRKFKYPMQFAKHRLVFITIAIAFVAMVAAGLLGWYALYQNQSTSDVLYRITTVLPISVAKIDGEPVRYSDYLMIYRSSITPVEQQNLGAGEQEMDSVRAYYKRTALTDAEDYTYAIKLAKQLGIEVTNEMVDQAFEDHRRIGGTDRSEETFLKVLKDNFGLSKAEYRRMLYLSLMKVEVSKKIDAYATDMVNMVQEKLQNNGGDLRAAAEELNNVEYEETGELVDVMNVDGGRATKAYNMSVGEISDVFVSQNGDAYYIIKVAEKADAKVNYQSIRIPFTEFDSRLANVREENRVTEYITFDDTSADNASEE